MYANYHTHTYRCMHAEGTPEQYVKSAVKGGMKILGFSDHVPYPYKDGFISNMRMKVGETADYVSDITSLREEYKDKIKIFIGYEAEYFPKRFSAMLENICSYECDYLILGQHFLDCEPNGEYSALPCSDDRMLGAYVDLVIEAIHTGKFSYIAHPDLPLPLSDADLYAKHMERMCREAKLLSVPLEINMIGFLTHRQYPQNEFWEIAKDIGNDIVIGCDAHCAEFLSNTEYHKKVYEYAKSFGFEPLKEIAFKKVK